MINHRLVAGYNKKVAAVMKMEKGYTDKDLFKQNKNLFKDQISAKNFIYKLSKKKVFGKKKAPKGSTELFNMINKLMHQKTA